jgi:hypothetical protein
MTRLKLTCGIPLIGLATATFLCLYQEVPGFQTLHYQEYQVCFSPRQNFISALFRLWDTYEFKLEDLFHGKLYNVSMFVCLFD